MKKKKWLALLLLLLSGSLLASCAGAEILQYGAIRADSEAEELVLKIEQIRKLDAFMDFLDQFPNLKKVDMYDCYTNASTVEALHERFPDIAFGMTLRFGKHRVRTDVTAFSTLYMEGDPVYDYPSIAQLRFCKNLYALDIGHNPVRRLDFLYEMPQLRVLIVALCDLTDITPIGSLRHLEYLELFHNRITDISCLADLPHLLDLNIVRNEIADLTPLSEIRTLKRLWIHECNRRAPAEPTEETVEMLRAALPDCEVNATATSTGGGWRKHPHYDVLRKMFRSKTYIPFEDSFAEEPLADNALSDYALTDNALSDDALSGDALSGDALSDDALSDDALSDDALSGDALSNDALSGDALTGNALSDDALAGDALTDNALSGDALSGDALSGDSAAEAAPAKDE